MEYDFEILRILLRIVKWPFCLIKINIQEFMNKSELPVIHLKTNWKGENS